MRSGPSTDHEIIGQASYGQAFRRIAVSADWSLVLLADGSQAYLYNYYLSLTPLELEADHP